MGPGRPFLWRVPTGTALCTFVLKLCRPLLSGLWRSLPVLPEDQETGVPAGPLGLRHTPVARNSQMGAAGQVDGVEVKA